MSKNNVIHVRLSDELLAKINEIIANSRGIFNISKLTEQAIIRLVEDEDFKIVLEAINE